MPKLKSSPWPSLKNCSACKNLPYRQKKWWVDP
jgi:hypothetical protein